MKIKKKKLFVCALILCAFIAIDSLAFSTTEELRIVYPDRSDWYVVHNSYHTNYNNLDLATYGNGYYARQTATGGTDPYNGVHITCLTNNMNDAYISASNTDVSLAPSSPFGNYVRFNVVILYTPNGGYYSTNSGTIRAKNIPW